MFCKVHDSKTDRVTWINKNHIEAIIFIEREKDMIKILLSSAKEFRADSKYLQELLS